MDLFIVIAAVAGCLLFWILHAVLIRLTGGRSVYIGLFAAMVTTLLVQVPLTGFLADSVLQNHGGTVINSLTIAFLAGMITALISFTYVLAVFGITVTSIRIQILTSIWKSGDRGVPGRSIKERFSQQTITNVRLERLVGSGELVYRQSRYYPGKRLSYLLLHTYALVLLNRLYGKPAYRRFYS